LVREGVAFAQERMSATIERVDRFLKRIDEDDDVGSRREVDLDLVIDVELAIVRRPNFNRDIRREKRRF
jgi:hypothetical protein